MSNYRTLLVPYDFSEHARAALATALELSQRLDAEVHLVHVVQSPTYAYDYGGFAGASIPTVVDMSQVRGGAESALQKLAAEQTGTRALKPHVVEGLGIADSIRETADKLGADLIVMGTHGRTGLAHAFLGSVAERTLRQASCPVLMVRAPDEGG